MLGAIIGDIVGSRFEFNNHRSKEFDFFHPGCFVTDDSIMTLAIGCALMDAHPWRDDPSHAERVAQAAVKNMQEIGRPYPNCGYGGRFLHWMYDDEPMPYNSFGNGAAMRVSPVGFYARSEEEVVRLSAAVTSVTHNHPEGIKGAEATAMAIYLARQGADLPEIRQRMETYYSLDFTIDEIRPTYAFNETCQDTVPQAITAFLESTSFEDAIRIGVSVGGDTDTLCAITGGIAEAFYGIPQDLREGALPYLDDKQRALFDKWEAFTALSK